MTSTTPHSPHPHRPDLKSRLPHFATGVLCFNRQAFFEAHETWEEDWHGLAEGPNRQVLQGLIQLAVALTHLQRHNLRGAQRKLRKALDRIQPVLDDSDWSTSVVKELLQWGEGFYEQLCQVTPVGAPLEDEAAMAHCKALLPSLSHEEGILFLPPVERWFEGTDAE